MQSVVQSTEEFYIKSLLSTKVYATKYKFCDAGIQLTLYASYQKKSLRQWNIKT